MKSLLLKRFSGSGLNYEEEDDDGDDVEAAELPTDHRKRPRSHV
jgi:hypothetical protein